MKIVKKMHTRVVMWTPEYFFPKIFAKIFQILIIIISSTPQSTSDTPMSDNMSETSCAQENAKWDPVPDPADEHPDPDPTLLPVQTLPPELLPDSQLESRLSIRSNLRRFCCEVGTVLTPFGPSRSVRQSKSAKLAPPAGSTLGNSSCLISILTRLLLLFVAVFWFKTVLVPYPLLTAMVVAPAGGMLSKNSATTLGSVACRMTS